MWGCAKLLLWQSTVMGTFAIARQYHSLNSTCPCKTIVTSSRTKALCLIHREHSWRRRTVSGKRSLVTQRGPCLVLSMVLLPLATRDWREWLGAPRRKQQCFGHLWIPVISKIAEFIFFVFKYSMTILMLLYSPCVGARAKDGTVSGVEHANSFKWVENWGDFVLIF